MVCGAITISSSFTYTIAFFYRKNGYSEHKLQNHLLGDVSVSTLPPLSSLCCYWRCGSGSRGSLLGTSEHAEISGPYIGGNSYPSPRFMEVRRWLMWIASLTFLLNILVSLSRIFTFSQSISWSLSETCSATAEALTDDNCTARLCSFILVPSRNIWPIYGLDPIFRSKFKMTSCHMVPQ